MKQGDLDLLKSSVDKLVQITRSDGEVLIARVHFVFDEYEDVVVELVSTNRESKYEKHDVQPAYAIDFQDIERVESLPPSAEKGGASTKMGKGRN